MEAQSTAWSVQLGWRQKLYRINVLFTLRSWGAHRFLGREEFLNTTSLGAARGHNFIWFLAFFSHTSFLSFFFVFFSFLLLRFFVFSNFNLVLMTLYCFFLLLSYVARFYMWRFTIVKNWPVYKFSSPSRNAKKKKEYFCDAICLYFWMYVHIWWRMCTAITHGRFDKVYSRKVPKNLSIVGECSVNMDISDPKIEALSTCPNI